MKWCVAPVLGACVLAAGTGRADDAAKKDDDDAAKKDLALLEGTWVIAGKEFMGKKATKEEVEKLRGKLVIKDGKWALWSDDNDKGKEEIVYEATFKFDAAAKPKELDLAYTSGVDKGTTKKAIYEIDGDTLRVCYPFMGAGRPTEFAGPPEGKALLMTYKRVRKEDENTGKRDLVLLEGTWVIAGKEFMGKKASKEEVETLAAESEMVIKEGKRTLNDLIAKKIASEATLKLDATAKPKAMDLTYTSGDLKGETVHAIYEIGGDMLKVCYPLEPDAERPTELAGKLDGKAFLLTYKRVKK
jgi:uncharacterized protein (TIGR03067 family)